MAATRLTRAAARSALCTASELHSALSQSSKPLPIVLDASWHLDPARDGRVEYEGERIQGALYFDINEVADPDAGDLPHMFPPASVVKAAIQHFGLAPEKEVVVYDAAGLFSAPRVWWMLRVMGMHHVRILNGGLPAWKAAGLPVDTTPTTAPALLGGEQAGADGARAPGEAITSSHLVRLDDIKGMLDAMTSEATSVPCIVDARPAGRFRGEAPEPRPIPSGHMPGALNLPASELVDQATGCLLSPEALLAKFSAAGVDVASEHGFVTSCGSGVTAAIVLLALHEVGVPWDRLALYDGSWSEYASASGAAIEPALAGR